jgi:hypothetical protein
MNQMEGNQRAADADDDHVGRQADQRWDITIAETDLRTP